MLRALLFLAIVCRAAAQDFSELALSRIAGSQLFADGPVWSPEGYLLWSDVPANLLRKASNEDGVRVLREGLNGPAGNAFDDKGRLYTCESRARRVLRTDKNGKSETLAVTYEGKKLNGPNDIVVSKSGHTYFTDPAFGDRKTSRELDFYGVFHISPKGELKAVLQWKTRPNGIALSTNARTLYVTDSDERLVRAYDVARDGSLSGERVAVAQTDGPPAGIKVDEKGNLYIAANQIQIFTPEGKLIRSLTVPERPSNLTFGDNDLQSIYITARTSVFRARVPVKGAVQY